MAKTRKQTWEEALAVENWKENIVYIRDRILKSISSNLKDNKSLKEDMANMTSMAPGKKPSKSPWRHSKNENDAVKRTLSCQNSKISFSLSHKMPPNIQFNSIKRFYTVKSADKLSILLGIENLENSHSGVKNLNFPAFFLSYLQLSSGKGKCKSKHSANELISVSLSSRHSRYMYNGRL